MVNSTCGYQNITDRPRILKVQGGCGVHVGYLAPEPWGYPLIPATPHFHNGIAWCHECFKGFQIRHLGQGVFVRLKYDDDVPLPKCDSDGVPFPKLEELYS